ncbi:uncharacterized protein OCT59_004811 [Rhizophagus irregularis]|uniref:uncharacterized protein n=1 Tax=Rhizophagus irregularis TaxID=588596 RepID=UPI00332C10E7|nr:hypothetical protein OCT59_004811 [Rhizophagus irregularis]
MMGVLGAFAISSLIHEYLVIANFNIWTGEQSFFFMIHVFPAFIEPSLRNHDKLPTIPTFTADYVKRFVVNNL